MMLDTICNVFGGIVLMSVLVVVHTQAAVQGLAAGERAARQAALTARELALQIEVDAADLEILQQQQQLLADSCARNIPSTTNALLDRQHEFLTSIAAAELRLADLQARQGDMEEQLGKAAAELEDAQGLLEQAEQDSEEAANTAGQDAPPPRQLRLPMSHKSRAAGQLPYVVVGSRVYPVGEPRHCERIALGGDATELRPVRGAGLPVSADGANAGFVRTLTGSPSRTHYVTFFVKATDESFETVQILRRIVGDAGYDFGYCLYDPDGPIVVSPGNPDVQ